LYTAISSADARTQVLESAVTFTNYYNGMFFACKTLVKTTIPVSSMKFIISGMPCCGKTYFGDWLRDAHGYTHVNLEPCITAQGTVMPPKLYWEMPEWLAGLSSRIVVTWGYKPVLAGFDFIRRFEQAGFVPWWFEADPGLVKKQYILRDGATMAKRDFGPQMEKLQESMPLISGVYRERRITTLNEDGYLPPEAILKKLEVS
jgi:hypothetical protein